MKKEKKLKIQQMVLECGACECMMNDINHSTFIEKNKEVLKFLH